MHMPELGGAPVRDWLSRSRTKNLLKSKLIRDTGWTFGLKVLARVLGLVVALFLARALGAEGYGIYSFAFAVVTLLALPAQAGLPTLLVRETARGLTTGRDGIIKGVWAWAGRVAGAISLLLLVGAGAYLFLTSDGELSAEESTLLWAFLLVPLLAFGYLRGAALQGLNRMVAGQLPELVLRPALFIALIGAVMVGTGSLSAPQAMALHVLAAGVAFGVGAWLLWKYTPTAVRDAHPERESRAWLAAMLPLALISGVATLQAQADILVLGIYEPADQVGIYRIAVQLAILALFGLEVVNVVVTPRFARMSEEGDLEGLQRLAAGTARFVLALSSAVVLFFIVFGQQVIELLFGSEFVSAYQPLLILFSGHLVSAAAGPAGRLLMMAGYERDVAMAGGVSAVFNLVLNFALIPRFGMAGAAVAMAAAMSLQHIWQWWAGRRRLGINSLAFHRAGKRPRSR